MPRDPKDISVTGGERTQRRLGELDDQKDPIRLRVGAGPAGAEGPKGAEGAKGETGTTGAEGPPGAASTADWKDSCRAATTANITISTALNNGDTLDGVTLATNDRVLVKNQTTTKENGIWVVGASPARATDADAAGELSGGTSVYVEEGTVNKRRVWTILTAGSITPGTTSHEWAQLQGRDFGLVEALPTTEAVKGDRCSYVMDKTNGIVNEFVYDGEGELPWKFIGGPVLFAEVTTAQSTSSETYADLATVGPSIKLPLAGDYDVEIGVRHNTGGAVGANYMSYAIGGTGAVDADGIAIFGVGEEANFMRRRRKTGLTAIELVAKYKNTGKTSVTFEARWIAACPIRCK